MIDLEEPQRSQILINSRIHSYCSPYLSASLLRSESLSEALRYRGTGLGTCLGLGSREAVVSPYSYATPASIWLTVIPGLVGLLPRVLGILGFRA